MRNIKISERIKNENTRVRNMVLRMVNRCFVGTGIIGSYNSIVQKRSNKSRRS